MCMTVTYLTAKQLLIIQSMILDETGGSSGVRNRELLMQIVENPQQVISGAELYNTVFKKAAKYLEGTITLHPFVDGNKRTAITAAGAFLERNGYKIKARQGEQEKLVLSVIENKLSVEDIATWFEQHAKRNREKH